MVLGGEWDGKGGEKKGRYKHRGKTRVVVESEGEGKVDGETRGERRNNVTALLPLPTIVASTGFAARFPSYFS